MKPPTGTSKRRSTCPNVLKAALIVAATCVLVAEAGADERYFTYSYEPKVLPKGAVEVEQWATMRNGRVEGLYTRWDLRTEFELGVTDRLTAAVYMMNATNKFEQRADGKGGLVDKNAMYFRGWSSAWKWKLADPSADPLGVLLYGEVAVDRREWEAEAKVVLGRNVGPFVFAANGVFEREWKGKVDAATATTHTETENVVAVTAGATYRTGRVALGVEAVNHNEIVKGETEHSALFAGPAFHANADRWWATLTLLRQLTDVLDEHERTEMRLILGVHL
jgi:hypothetical protein